MISQQRNVSECNFTDGFGCRLVPADIFGIVIAQRLDIISTHFMLLKHDCNRTIFRNARGCQCREQQVFLFAVMAFVDKDFQKLQDSIKMLFVQIPVRL